MDRCLLASLRVGRDIVPIAATRPSSMHAVLAIAERLAVFRHVDLAVTLAVLLTIISISGDQIHRVSETYPDGADGVSEEPTAQRAHTIVPIEVARTYGLERKQLLWLGLLKRK